ncbi:hypothetical protein C5S32_03090 [ANME-1 cluster archaeon GoMg1]|nr:hypothetical protein [ANME-1 cluster archaeon GoMg1]
MVKVSLRNDNRGVSVIFGTLMLILIVVTAASGLALMMSEMQKEEMERRSHIADVENEELKILYIDLEKSSTSTYWSSMNITILNLNVEDSYVTAISVNDRYAANYTADGERFNLSNRLLIPATRSKEVHLNFTSNFTTPLNISGEEPIRIGVITSLINSFERTFKPPTPIIHTGVEIEDLGVADRAVLVLAGSDSFDDGSVISWNWTLWDASNTVPPGNWSDTNNIARFEYSGKIVRVISNSSGSFKVRLTVKDDTEMEGTSKNITIPANPNFNPATNLNAEKSGNQIKSKIKDIEGKPVKGIAVNFLVLYDKYGNLTLNPWSNTTDENGEATTTVIEGNGTIRVLSGKLAYVDIAI